MSSIATYRAVTLIAAAGSSVLSASTLAFLVTALVSFRAEDLFTASKIEDFTTLGTCVETLTYEQLDELDYRNRKPDCENLLGIDNREKLTNTLSATVHGVYYMHYTIKGGTGTWSHLGIVMLAQLTHVLGKQFGTDVEKAELVNVGINATTVFEVLREVSQGIVPVECNEIYAPNTFETLSADPLLVAYVDGIRKGRLDDDDKVKSTWPLADFVTTCNEKEQPDGVGFFTSRWDRIMDANMKKYLHAHCVAQFQYASVGSGNYGDGTYGMPLPGIVAGPHWNIQPIAHFNSSSTYNEKARMYIGQRFGMSVWAYVPMILCTCYLLGDSVVFFFAEALMPIGRANAIHSSASNKAYLVDSLLISASTSGSRMRRFGIGFLAVLSSLTFYIVFMVSAWGFMSNKMPRPECESRTHISPIVDPSDAAWTPNIEVGDKPDHGVVHIFWKGTVGGWKADYDAGWYEIAALITQVLVLFLLPFTTWQFCSKCNKAVDKPLANAPTVVVADAVQVTAWTSQKFRTHQRKLIPLLMLGIVIIILGQSISGANFGVAWADGVMERRKGEDGKPLFDERVLAENVYDQTIATLSLVVSCGLVFAVIMQRYLVAGVGCFNTSLFFMWVGLVFVLSLPIAVYAAKRSIFSESIANEECSVFPRGSHETEDNLCVMRFWSLVVGGGIFYGTVGYVTLSGLAEAIPALAFAKYFKQRVNQAKIGDLANVMESSQAGTAPAVSPSSCHYHSETEPFFNNVIKNDTSSKKFFNGGKLWTPQAHK